MKYFLTLLIFTLSLVATGKEYTIDLSDSFSMSAFVEAGVPLKQPPSVVKDPNRRTLPNDARYVFKLPTSNNFIFEAHMGHVEYAFEDRENAGRLVLYGNKPQYYLTIDEAYAVLEQFHDTFEIPKEPLIDWFEPIKKGLGARGYYQAGARTNYPRVTIEAANSFFEDRPVFLNLIISFNQGSFKRLGLSAETNNTRNLTFDVPAIIDSVRSQTAVTEIPTDASSNEVEESAEEATVSEPATEDPAEAETPDTPEEPTEQSSQWWLWLIGAVVVVGGISLTLRRKG